MTTEELKRLRKDIKITLDRVIANTAEAINQIDTLIKIKSKEDK